MFLTAVRFILKYIMFTFAVYEIYRNYHIFPPNFDLHFCVNYEWKCISKVFLEYSQGIVKSSNENLSLYWLIDFWNLTPKQQYFSYIQATNSVQTFASTCALLRQKQDQIRRKYSILIDLCEIQAFIATYHSPMFE